MDYGNFEEVKGPHKTAIKLLDTARELHQGRPLDQITVDDVINASGISRSSLYHHYEDFPHLLEHVLAAEFAEATKSTIAVIRKALETSSSREEFRLAMSAINDTTQTPERASARMQRIVAFATTDRNARFRVVLGEEQQRLTNDYASIIAQAQAKGWADPSLDPEAIAIFIQAFTIGRIVDDVAKVPIPPDRWIDFTMMILDRVLFTSP